MSEKQLRLQPQGGSFIKNAVGAALVRLGSRSQEIEKDKERINRRVLPPDGDPHHFNDSFVFQGSADDGVMFMSRLGFRDDGSVAEVWVFLDLDGQKLVNTNTLLTLSTASDTEVSAGGLSYVYQPDEDGWRITYDGPLDRAEHCSLDLMYRPSTRIYLSSEHMDPVSTGKAMAEMPWSRAYFQRLKSERQVRMEQGGTIKGTVQVDGTEHRIDLQAFRDHSWGKRDWTFLNRYIWNILSLNKPLVLAGDEYTHFCYTTVDYGSSFKHLVSGWIAGPTSVLPIVASSDMNLLASDGVIPEKYDIVFRPKGLGPVTGQVHRLGAAHGWMLQGNDFEVNEAYCKLTIEGIEGQGMSEFGFSRSCGIHRPCFVA
jgi:hypothetical protein